MAKHMSFTEVVNGIVEQDWGRDFDTPEHAAKQMMTDLPRLTAFAIVELLRRLNALAGKRPSHSDDVLKIPKNAKRCPNKSVGERLYVFDSGSGICEYIIVAKNKDGVCLIVNHREFDLERPPHVWVATDSMFETIEEAVKSVAESDIEYYRPRLAFAEKALKAVKGGKDLTEYLEGYGDE